jgi:hypothetical protein
LVDAALFASWRSLPWQSRVCPRALEERESVRLLAAMVQEKRRIAEWTAEQNKKAMESAGREDRRFGDWVRRERERTMTEEEAERERVKKFETQEAAKVAIHEGTERERVNQQIEAAERVRVCVGLFREFHNMRDNLVEIYSDNHASEEEIEGELRRRKKWHRDEAVLVSWHTAAEQARALDFKEKEGDRVRLHAMKQAHKTNGIWAAAIARFTAASNAEDELAFENWREEVARVDAEDVEEKGRIEAWETLTHAIMKAAKANVLRLLAPDTAVVDFEDEVERSKYYRAAYGARTRTEKGKFQKQR